MKSLNGLLFIIIGGAIIWVGATGRLPALAAALGMVRKSPGSGGTNTQTNQSAPEFSGVTSGSSSSVTSAGSGDFFPLETKKFFSQIGGANSAAVDAISQANGNFYYNVLGLK